MEPPPSCHPILSDGYEIRPNLIAMVHAQSFSGNKGECPYAHLQEFKENCSLLTIPSMNQNTLWWKLFLFSLTGEAKVWYNRKARRVGGDWIELKDEFCLFFFPVTKVLPLCIQLLSFKQGEESLGAAWARFMLMANFGPPHSIPEEMLMQHLVGGLNPESTQFMNVAFEGSIMYKIVAEVRTILEKVLDSTQYTGVFDDPPKPIDQPKEKQQVHILSAASSPPPPHIEEITEPFESTNHEPLIEDMPIFIPDLFTEEEYMELGNASNMPKEHECICSRSEVFIFEATPQN
jgi:hypothetical protein